MAYLEPRSTSSLNLLAFGIRFDFKYRLTYNLPCLQKKILLTPHSGKQQQQIEKMKMEIDAVKEQNKLLMMN
jgi:hypothetical protein